MNWAGGAAAAGFAWRVVELVGNFQESFWAARVKIQALREMLAQEPVGLFYICQGPKWLGLAFEVRKIWRAR
jgi:hypothetical protein